MFNGKKVLVTGGTGMIGRYLVEILRDRGAFVRVVSLDQPKEMPTDTEFMRLNLMSMHNCLKACNGMDYVFNLAGIKGSPAMTKQKPASFFVPTIIFSLNMMEAARQTGIEKFLFTSSVGVYSPADIFREDDVWKTFPSENDKFAGWAKRMGELQAEAYKIEYDWKYISIVRPANVYGRFDNFDSKNAMVIPSLISRIYAKENPLVVWGDGSAIRDFIHGKDVARGMIFAMENEINEPINLGSGTGVSIKQLVETIQECATDIDLKIEWDKDKPSGDKMRILDMSKANTYGFETVVSLKEGILDTINWFKENKETATQRYNVFNEGIKV